MPRIRRKKKKSISQDDEGNDVTGKDEHEQRKHRGQKIEEVHHLPTIDDESYEPKPQVRFLLKF